MLLTAQISCEVRDLPSILEYHTNLYIYCPFILKLYSDDKYTWQSKTFTYNQTSDYSSCSKVSLSSRAFEVDKATMPEQSIERRLEMELGMESCHLVLCRAWTEIHASAGLPS